MLWLPQKTQPLNGIKLNIDFKVLKSELKLYMLKFCFVYKSKSKLIMFHINKTKRA